MTASPEKIVSQNRRVGTLDGLTILRFAHTCGTGGGLERYLIDLHRALGARNQFTTIQLELAYDKNSLAEQAENFGGCKLIKVPLFTEPVGSVAGVNPETEKNSNLKSFAGRVLCAEPVYQNFTRHVFKNRIAPRRAGEPDGAGVKTRELIKRFKIDLIVLHSSGGADASEIIAEAKVAKIPVALVNHFSNDRLAGLSVRQQIGHCAGVAGVCNVEVPAYLRGRYQNLSDGIDTDFFQRTNARPLPKKFSAPILFLPARLTPTKGQADLLRAAAVLKRRGLRTTVVFAGRIDTPEFAAELRRLAENLGLAGDVEFAGQLGPEQLRDWYAAAAVMVFPTRHHEGLGRVTVEAQAMGLPPVVYDIGGTPDGLIDGETGFLIPLGDEKRLADAVGKILKDAALRGRMARAGREFAEKNFSLEALAQRHEKFCAEIISSRAKN